MQSELRPCQCKLLEAKLDGGRSKAGEERRQEQTDLDDEIDVAVAPIDLPML